MFKVCNPWLIHSGLRVAKFRFGSNILILARPQSITYTMSSIVTELSAMFVAMTIFLQYAKRMQPNTGGDIFYIPLKPLFRLCGILIRIRILRSLYRTTDPDLAPDPDPALFVSGFQDPNKNKFFITSKAKL